MSRRAIITWGSLAAILWLFLIGPWSLLCATGAIWLASTGWMSVDVAVALGRMVLAIPFIITAVVCLAFLCGKPSTP
jgi:hypothetical protein